MNEILEGQAIHSMNVDGFEAKLIEQGYGYVPATFQLPMGSEAKVTDEKDRYFGQIMYVLGYDRPQNKIKACLIMYKDSIYQEILYYSKNQLEVNIGSDTSIAKGWELTSTESFVIPPDTDRLVDDSEVEIPCVSIQKLAEQAIEEIQNMSVDDFEAMLIKHGHTPVRLTDTTNHVFNIPIGSVIEVIDPHDDNFEKLFWVHSHNKDGTYLLSRLKRGGDYFSPYNEDQLKEYLN